MVSIILGLIGLRSLILVVKSAPLDWQPCDQRLGCPHSHHHHIHLPQLDKLQRSVKKLEKLILSPIWVDQLSWISLVPV